MVYFCMLLEATATIEQSRAEQTRLSFGELDMFSILVEDVANASTICF
jgi:hypothetical protein